MSKKKKPVRKLRPRTTYDVTLEHATARLGKAVQERTDCLTKLEALSRQIPWLENLVHALTPVPEAPPPSPGEPLGAPTPPYYPPPPPTEPVPEEFLARFMPKPGRLTTSAPPVKAQPHGTSTDPDEFLNDDSGSPMLP